MPYCLLIIISHYWCFIIIYYSCLKEIPWCIKMIFQMLYLYGWLTFSTFNFLSHEMIHLWQRFFI